MATEPAGGASPVLIEGVSQCVAHLPAGMSSPVLFDSPSMHLKDFNPQTLATTMPAGGSSP
eukprot:136190-Karenia_brevis.AAC.1